MEVGPCTGCISIEKGGFPSRPCRRDEIESKTKDLTIQTGAEEEKSPDPPTVQRVHSAGAGSPPTLGTLRGDPYSKNDKNTGNCTPTK